MTTAPRASYLVGGDVGEALPELDDGGLHLSGGGQRADHLHLQKYASKPFLCCN